jgi:hypothetical protein
MATKVKEIIRADPYATINATGANINKLIPELNSDKEFTAFPNTKGVPTLAILAKTKAIIAKTTLVFKSLRFLGHR